MDAFSYGAGVVVTVTLPCSLPCMSDGGARALSLTDVLGATGALGTDLRTEMRAEIGGLRTELRTEFGALRTDIATLQTNWGVLLEFASSDVISSQFGASLGASCTRRTWRAWCCPSWRRTAN